jgi:hypothetical protein
MSDGEYLRCLVHIVGRSAIAPKDVRALVGDGKNRIKAFNLFNGELTIADVAHKTKIDQGNLSRAATAWVEYGIAFWIGRGKDARLLHIYPIPEKERRQAK